MVSITIKKIKGKEYLYLVESIRKGDNVTQKTVKYIGRKRPVLNEELECMKLSYYNNDWILTEFRDELPYTEHHKMKIASGNYKKYLNSLDSMSREKEKQKLLSNFIASSNAIEGSTLTPKETYDFLFNDLVPKDHSKKEFFMAQNLLSAWEYVEANCSRFPTHNDLFELHKRVNLNIETEKTLGKYKTVQNYIGDVYTSSFLFAQEKMDKLLQWIKAASSKIDDFEAAFQSHAQFEIIHPFVDGNGRVGRLLLNWLLMMNGVMPLAIRSKMRNEYISALNNARNGKFEAISKFCSEEYLEQYKF